jgi:TPR repeat protein
LAQAALAVAVMAAGSMPLHAAKGRAPRDSAPVLTSRTGGAGGADMWADVKELEQAAMKGNPRAETQLGEMLLRGDGIDKNEARGIALLEKAARAGQAPAAFRIGMLLAHGDSGLANDPVRALEYFKAAAAGGEAEAFFNIGAAYASARGVRRNYAEALGWLIVAQQRGAESNAADALRAQIKSRPDWIATGERRAKEIEQEFADKKVVDLLPPPAPLDQVFDPLRPTGPTSASSKR